MKHILLVLGSALALMGGTAVAADDAGKSASHTSSTSQSQPASGGGFVEKTKEAFHKLGESVKSGFHKAENKADNARTDDKDGTRTMGGPGKSQEAGSTSASATRDDRQKRMDSAYDDYKKSSSDHAKSK